MRSPEEYDRENRDWRANESKGWNYYNPSSTKKVNQKKNNKTNDLSLVSPNMAKYNLSPAITAINESIKQIKVLQKQLEILESNFSNILKRIQKLEKYTRKGD